MSSLVLSIPSAPAAPNAAAASGAASSPARGRDAQSPTDAEGFGAALARSRDARARQADDKAESASDAPPARRRGPASSAQREEASPADLLAMAMLTPAFGAPSLLQQQQRAAAQGDEAGAGGARALVDGATTATAGEALASTDASASAVDARSPAKAGTGADTAATQAAQSSAAEQADKDGKDAKSAKSKADALPAADAKTPTPAVPTAGGAPMPGANAAAAANAPNASPTAAASTAKTTADAAALRPLAAKDIAPAEHHLEEASSDASAQLPGAFTFKAALAEAANAAAPAQAQPLPRFTVPTPVGNEGWGADIGTQMIRMGADGHHVAELSLNPAGLGPLKVTLTLGDNQAQAMFVSAHESVRRALEAALPQLRDTLAGQGIQLGQASVDAGTPQQQQQAFNQERSLDAPARSAPRDLARTGATVDTEAPRAAPRSRASNGIDTFA